MVSASIETKDKADGLVTAKLQFQRPWEIEFSQPARLRVSSSITQGRHPQLREPLLSIVGGFFVICLPFLMISTFQSFIMAAHQGAQR